MFLAAQLPLVLSIVIAFVLYFALPGLVNIPLSVMLLVAYLDITVLKIMFEHQRITLALARLSRHEAESFSTVEVQALITSNTMAAVGTLEAVIAGVIIAYMAQLSIFFLIAYLV